LPRLGPTCVSKRPANALCQSVLPGRFSRLLQIRVLLVDNIYLAVIFILDPNPYDPIQRFPYVVLISILSYLSFSEVVAAQRVSRQWHSYLQNEPFVYRHLSFLGSKHNISTKTLRRIVSASKGCVSSLEFTMLRLQYFAPFTSIYHHIERLVVYGTFYDDMSKIFINKRNSSHPQVLSLRTVIFGGCRIWVEQLIQILLNTPNLEEFECKYVIGKVDVQGLECLGKWGLKRLRIRYYSELPLEHGVELVDDNRSPVLIRVLPELEELVLGLESSKVLDLTPNTNLRHLDFDRMYPEPIKSIIAPQSLEICLNAPVSALSSSLGDWGKPPSFRCLSCFAHPLTIATFPKVLFNSHQSLVALRVSYVEDDDVVRSERETIEAQDFLSHMLASFHNLHFLNISFTNVIGDRFITRLPPLDLEYVCLARTAVTSHGVVDFLTKTKGVLKELNVVDTCVGEDVLDVARNNGVTLETEYPGKPIPGTVAMYDLYGS
jgi:F-box-like